MISSTDQLNRTIELKNYPQRIISLVPSQTELLVDLGLEDRLVGLTKFCVHPAGLKKRKTVIGGTKTLNLDSISALKPDLIIGNKEENDLESIQKLEKSYPVWISEVNNLEDAYSLIHHLGQLLDVSEKAKALSEAIKKTLEKPRPRLGSVVYLIWQNPLMAAGAGTFIDHMLHKAGFENLMRKSRYPVLEMEMLQSLNPEYLLLSSEPFPFKTKHLRDFEKALPKSKVRMVDGEVFSWYGSSLLKSGSYFEQLSNILG
ncbi:ABC transporter substrate-binding protein [Pararhodonellum marinum]|uniref:ABC transporter substrate-binding protein n=1 Tax=Pararhodonellum marinum TaxID=2755358 RepID=UPI00188F6DF4|nr:helical backbone metal receptor [Pararhodonellum marinum]